MNVKESMTSPQWYISPSSSSFDGRQKQDWEGESDGIDTMQTISIPVSGFKESGNGTNTSAFERDLLLLDRRQQEWNQALNIEDQGSVLRNYNPVISRVNFEKCTTDQARIELATAEMFEIETVLRERYKSFSSTFEHFIDDQGKLRSSLLPKEPFEDVLRRGVAYRKANGSVELEREEKEVEGVVAIQEKSQTAKVGTKYILFSPPGIVDGSTYTHRFVDYGELIGDKDGTKKWKFTRFESDMSDEEYADIARTLDQGFFDGQTGPIDAWYLSHPIFKSRDEMPQTAEEMFDMYLQRPEDAFDDEEMQEIILEAFPYSKHLVQLYLSQVFDPRKIALTINTMLIKTDRKRAEIKARRKGEVIFTHENSYNDIDEEIEYEGLGRVEKIDAGCGMSGGYDMDGESGGGGRLMENSVGRFGVSLAGEKKTLSCNCPFCNQRVEAMIEGGRITCPRPSCGKSATYNC